MRVHRVYVYSERERGIRSNELWRPALPNLRARNAASAADGPLIVLARVPRLAGPADTTRHAR